MRFLLIMAFWIPIISVIGFVASITIGCGDAKASDPVTVQTIVGPNGTTCYIIYNRSIPIGGNCIK